MNENFNTIHTFEYVKIQVKDLQTNKMVAEFQSRVKVEDQTQLLLSTKVITSIIRVVRKLSDYELFVTGLNYIEENKHYFHNKTTWRAELMLDMFRLCLCTY